MTTETKITMDDVTRERKRYLDHEISHAEYHEWLADSLGITMWHVPVDVERIRASTDKHLNDIPLKRWDAMDGLVRDQARRNFGSPFSWSLSDTVCVLKAVARRAARA